MWSLRACFLVKGFSMDRQHNKNRFMFKLDEITYLLKRVIKYLLVQDLHRHCIFPLKLPPNWNTEKFRLLHPFPTKKQNPNNKANHSAVVYQVNCLLSTTLLKTVWEWRVYDLLNYMSSKGQSGRNGSLFVPQSRLVSSMELASSLPCLRRAEELLIGIFGKTPAVNRIVCPLASSSPKVPDSNLHLTPLSGDTLWVTKIKRTSSKVFTTPMTWILEIELNVKSISHKLTLA